MSTFLDDDRKKNILEQAFPPSECVALSILNPFKIERNVRVVTNYRQPHCTVAYTGERAEPHAHFNYPTWEHVEWFSSVEEKNYFCFSGY